MRFYNVISIVPNRTEECATDLRRLNTECGIDTFAAMVPFHPQGAPLLQKTEEFMERYQELSDAVSSDGIRGGILLQSLINHGDRGLPDNGVPFQGITGSDGTTCIHCFCPMDKDFQNYTRTIVTMMAKANPEFILIDDDFRMHNHLPVLRGCFCDAHMKAFNQRYGHNFSREELGAILEDGGKDGQEISSQWSCILREGLLEMCRVIREAINAVNPAIRSGLCMNNVEDEYAEDIINTLAGDTLPLVRVGNANYKEAEPHYSSRVILGASRALPYIPERSEVVSESDTYPQHLYSVSPQTLRHHIAASMLGGTQGAKLWITDIRNGEMGEGEEYINMLATSRNFFDTLCDFAKTINWQGPVVTYPPRSVWLPAQATDNNPHGDNGLSWAILLNQLGIAFIEGDSPANVRIMSGEAPTRFDKQTLESFFKTGLLLDGAAAKEMYDMGFGELMGVKVENARIPYAHEWFDPSVEINRTAGGKTQSFGTHNFEHKRLTPLDESVQLASHYVGTPWFQSSDETLLAPAVTLYKNRLGGRVAITARPINGEIYGSYDFLSPKRRAQLAGIIDWLNDAPTAYAEHDQRCTMRYGKIKDDTRHVLAFINYCQNPIEPLHVRIPDAQAIQKTELLGADGQWREIEFDLHPNNQVTFKLKADLRDVVVLRIG